MGCGTVYLETPRLRLREFTLADAPLLVELDSDPEVMRFITAGRPSPPEIFTHSVLPRWLSYYARDDGYGYWAAIERATGAFCGWFHLRPAFSDPRLVDQALGWAMPPQAQEIDLGYRLSRRVWGLGYATEGAKGLINKAFGELSVPCVIATAMAGNTASIRVMEKVGLRYVADFIEERFPGADRRAVKYGLRLEEWGAASDNLSD